MRIPCIAIFLLFQLGCATSVTTERPLTIASPFSEHMVLQRQMEVPVWGQATSNARVRVSVAGKSARAKTDNDGHWKLKLPELPTGGPYQFQVTCGDETITFNDVLVGEVWICSGQSNMKMHRSCLKDIKTSLAEAKKRPIRYLPVKRRVALEPEQNISGQWKATPCKSAVGFSFSLDLQKALDVPVGVIETCWGSSSIEGWMPLGFTKKLPHFEKEMDAFEKYDREKVLPYIAEEKAGKKWNHKDEIYMRTRPNILYNAMLHPLAPYACRGMAWYQGEANAKSLPNSKQYGQSLPLWCNYLRELWSDDNFHFLAVMLPRFGRMAKSSPTKNLSAPYAHSWAWFREVQQNILSLPHTGIVNTIDLGHVTNIHPKDKGPVGQRLSLLALNQIYGKDIKYSGPVFEKMTQSKNTIQLHFTHAEGLRTTDGKAPREFWIAGKKRKWMMATAKIKGKKIILNKPANIEIEAVRYAFAAFPQVNLVNGEGLPAMPFRTDNDTPDAFNDALYLVGDEARRK